MNHQSYLRKAAASLLSLSLLIGIWLTGVVMAQAEPSPMPLANQNIFLPLITNGEAGRPPISATATATSPNQPTATATIQPNQPTPKATTLPDQPTATASPTDAPTAEPTSEALFLETEWRTSSASMKVDKNGGMHVGYYYYEAMHDNAPNWAVYAYCASACEKDQQWQRVNLAQDRDVLEVQLALTQAGQPRMLIRAASTVYPGAKDYLYAACDQNCTDASGWQVGYVATTDSTDIFDLYDDNSPQHSFALDPQDRPRFIFQDRNYAHAEPSLYGGYYAACDVDCTAGTPANPTWSRTRITDEYRADFQYQYEIIEYASLTFTSQGGPRFVANFYPTNQSGQPAGLFYFGCDTACDQRENWQRIYLIDRGSGTDPSWDLELDSQDRPRLAFYKGQANLAGEKLFYLWCNENCFDATKLGEQWSYNDPGVATTDGKHPDLELDTQGRPHIAYVDTTNGGLGYVWCSADCETDNAVYHGKVVESAELLQSVWPVAIPLHCDGGLWHGLTPILALDGTDKPHVAYDTTYHAHCLYDDPSDGQPPFSAFHLIIRAVRATVFDLP